MRIFLDENMPQQMTRALRSLGHEVESVHTLHLEGIANGELYRHIAQHFDLCFTKDEDFARKSGESLAQGTIKVIRVTIRQQPQQAYVEEFIRNFSRTNWNDYANGDDWP